MQVSLTEVKLYRPPVGLQDWHFYKVQYEAADGEVVWEGTLWLPAWIPKKRMEAAFNDRTIGGIHRSRKGFEGLSKADEEVKAESEDQGTALPI